MTPSTTSREFFEQKYQQNPDPWDFGADAYEQGRYAAILQALGGRRYKRAFEPGCSVGVLTVGLAGLCDEVIAMDIAPTAVEQARLRCSALGNVSLRCGSLAEQLPDGRFDLIVLSEIGYYFEEKALLACTTRLAHLLSHGGILLAAHWLGASEDHILSGDRVHALLAQVRGGLQHRHAERHAGFRIDSWKKEACG
jgi:protein-L-isoaspartate O-methyltransferase